MEARVGDEGNGKETTERHFGFRQEGRNLLPEDNRNPDLLKEYYRGTAKAFREILEFIDEDGLSGPITQIKATNNANSIDNSNRGDSIDVVFAAIGQ